MKRADSRIGEIIEIQDLEEYSNGFQKIKFILRTLGEYSQDLCFELHREKVDYLAAYDEGDFVEVCFDIKGNKGTDGKYYTNLIAWRLKYAG